MNKKSWIAYVGPFPFPWGQAGSRRICGMARTLAEAGNMVLVGSGDRSSGEPDFLNEGEPLGSVKYVGLGESPEKNASALNKSFRILFLWGRRTVAWLDSQPVKPSHVFIYGGSAQYVWRILPWCRKNNVKIVVDVVEWYDASHMTGGKYGPFNISAKIALRYLYSKCDGVVVISRALQDFYSKKGCQTIRVPPTLDVVGHVPPSQPIAKAGGVLTLVYAGTPGNKDLLGNVIKGVNQVDPLGTKVRLVVIGPSADQVKGLIGCDELPVFVDVLGRISQSDVAKYVASADFSVLLREPLFFANAGFPTKFVESMTNGTPVIANLTSDLGLYLRDGVEGIVCADHSADAFAAALKRVIDLTSEQRESMRIAARKQAETSFDFRVYANSFSSFLNSV